MTRPPSSSPFSRLLWAIVLVFAVIAAGCGSGGEDQVQVGPGGAPATGPAADGASLPTLPPIADRHPEQFTPEGCAATSDGPDCSVESRMIDESQAGAGEQDWRVLAGFSGTRWSDVSSGAVTVLEDAVTFGPGPTWSAMGLVRNDSVEPVGQVVVRATLLDGAGLEVGAAEVVVALPVVRPGEPAPFALAAETPTAEVAAVRWSTPHTPAASNPARDLEFAVYWERASTDVRPVDTHLYRDPADGSHPLVVFGATTAVGPDALDGLLVVGAWLDGDGRVVAVEHATLGAEAADPGASVDWVLVADGPIVGDVDQADLMLWGTGA